MIKLRDFLLRVLTGSFVISIISLLLAALAGDGFLHSLFGGVGLYGAVLTFWIFVVHVVVVVIGKLLKKA